MKRIEDEPNPQVGRFYWVPCVDYFPHFSRTDKPIRMPIIGPWHEDSDLGVEEHHFHYDLRFLQPDAFKASYMSRVHTSYSSNKKRSVRRTYSISIVAPKVTYRRRKMWQTMPEFPSRPKIEWVRRLNQEFADHVLKCRTCPHKGMSLDGLPMDDQGRVVCNGHGLRWNLNTGRLEPR